MKGRDFLPFGPDPHQIDGTDPTVFESVGFALEQARRRTGSLAYPLSAVIAGLGFFSLGHARSTVPACLLAAIWMYLVFRIHAVTTDLQSAHGMSGKRCGKSLRGPWINEPVHACRHCGAKAGPDPA
ncbi:hypothetical protein [uncultured Algimonas sp.]|uniref:hypothetical protein n=1 Tax=uncultured Algimonas sp. TaxID=1547920 RepID=UPI002601D8D5|nr:hypothetical protein [uncultured Algimonas sp.]